MADKAIIQLKKQSQVNEQNNLEPSKQKHVKMEKGNIKVIPSYDKIIFSSNETKDQYSIYITKFLQNLYSKDKNITLKMIKQIKWNQIRKYFQSIEKPGAQRNAKYALRHYFTHLKKFSLNKFKQLKLKPSNQKPKEILNEQEYKKVMKKIKKKKLQLIFQFLNNSGLRIKELINLQVKNITFKEGDSKGKVFIKKRKRGKSGYTTLLDDFADKMHNYVIEQGLSSNDFLFKNKFGKKYASGRSLNKTIKLYTKKAGIEKKGVSNHSFRHMFITNTILNCGIETANKLAGHKSMKTTQGYNHTSFETIQSQFKKKMTKESPKLEDSQRSILLDDTYKVNMKQLIESQMNQNQMLQEMIAQQKYLANQVKEIKESMKLQNENSIRLMETNKTLRQKLMKIKKL